MSARSVHGNSELIIYSIIKYYLDGFTSSVHDDVKLYMWH